ncbi:MAG TPA: metalloregulator ArsR/SmtB family transcription factor [Solirubrobacteraceae bacterium]|nr:metalloregulator ArsR/SmtB family transcription factor [Solirubrobacteraceae bacterium]
MSLDYGDLLHIDESQALALRAARLDADSAELVAERLRALGDPMRLGLALALRDGRELCVCDLSWIAQRPQNLTSHHMKVLRSAGIVAARKQGKMTMYRLTAQGSQLAEGVVAGWVSGGSP